MQDYDEASSTRARTRTKVEPERMEVHEKIEGREAAVEENSAPGPV